MARRKQKRRRDKERRHEYEVVYVDPRTGEEVEVDESELERPKREAKERDRPKAAPTTRGGRPMRKVEPASWRRVFKRSAIFAPLMFLLLALLNDELTIAQLVVQTFVLMAFFVPFSYMMDSFMYRTYLRRTGQAPPRKDRGKR